MFEGIILLPAQRVLRDFGACEGVWLAGNYLADWIFFIRRLTKKMEINPLTLLPDLIALTKKSAGPINKVIQAEPAS